MLALTPLAAWRANRGACDFSRYPFAEGFARDLLEPLPVRAILLTNGDNDSMPLWYMQQVEGVRPDVTVINLPTANTGTTLARLRRSDPDLAGLLAGEPERGVLPVRSVKDSTVTTRVEPRAGLGLPAGVAAPESVIFRPTGEMIGSDRLVLDLIRLERWRRPVHLACTVVRDHVPWLWPFARLDGLSFRVIPSDDPAVWDVDHLREQLFTRVRYRGIADSTVRMDVDSRAMCVNYVFALVQLASAQLERGKAREALATVEFLEDHVPPRRLGQAEDYFASLRAQIEAGSRGPRRRPDDAPTTPR
ncbi:MAG: hypothetical protein ACRENJ_04705 [Candidatus Eiseniibacteriota bacterium]